MGERLTNDGPFSHLSDEQLIRRIERAPDFGYDDESVELDRRLKPQRRAWRWSGDFHRPHVEVYEQAVIYDKTTEEWHEQLTTDEEGKPTGHLATPGSRYGRTASDCAWWAVAALSAYETDDLEDAELFVDHAMSRAVNDDAEVLSFIREYQDRIPREVIDRIKLEEASR